MADDTPITPGGNVVHINLEDELRNSYLDYSMSVIVNRALPDARDGLKPVQRRILVAMNELNLAPNRAHRKSAKITGDVTGNYHPHGTVAVYETMVRMAQDFSFRYPLVDGQGNFGSVDGDGAAAERYTEARLSRPSSEMLDDLDKETVNRRLNYDETIEEPVVLPSRFPNLLVNGATGIAVGMATNIPPHNLGEICDALLMMLETPDADDQAIMSIVKGPDFPTAGIIYGTRGIHDAYTTGRGLISVRGRAEIEMNEKKGRERILVTELPFQVNKATLLEKIAHLVKSGVIPGISDIRDESDRKGMRVVIELKKDVDGRVVLNRLYKHTTMQTTFGANMVALVDMQPLQLPLRRLLECFLGHRHEVVTRRTQYELSEAEKRAHILEGLRIALDHIDAIIETIRSSPDVPTARAGLMEKFELTEVQANAILEMRLARLTGLERDKLEEEYGGLIKEIERLTGILDNKALLKAVIGEEIADIRERFADPRRTEITIAGADLVDEDLIAEEEMVVTITHLGYVKRLPLHTYRAQRRGGKGIKGTASRDEDWADDIFVASTHDYMMFFTDRGRCYWLKVYEIPQAGRTARGKAIINCIQIGSDERVTAYTKVKTFDEDRFLVLATMKGQIKKTVLSAFGNPRRAGIRAINLIGGDTLIGADVTDGSNDVILATRTGRAVRFHEDALRAMGRTAGGVRGISLAGEEDQVVGMVVVVPDRTVLSVTEKGYGKRTPVEDYRLTNRGGKGVINMRITKKNGPVVTIKAVANDDELMIITSGGIVIRTEVSDISTMGRATQGVRLIKVNEDALVTDVARISQDSLTEGTEKGDDESKGTPELPADGPSGGGGEITDEMKADAQNLADDLVDESGDEPTDGSTDGDD